MRHLTDYIKEYPNCLSAELCDDMIARFEGDSRKFKGTTILGDNDAKKSTDLYISHLPEWKDIDSGIFTSLHSQLDKYLDFLYDELYFFEGSNLHDSGYQIQRTKPDQGYSWHSDHMVKGVRSPYNEPIPMVSHRIITFIFYLNDNFEGGQTQFFGDENVGVIPEKGKMIFFPATPMYVHQGATVTEGTKYIATGWVYSSYESIP